jgi:hypothetical protein
LESALPCLDPLVYSEVLTCMLALESWLAANAEPSYVQEYR